MPTRKPKIIMREINGIEINQRLSNGYMNATEICDACDKEFSDYFQTRVTKRFLKELSNEIGIDKSDLVIVKTQEDTDDEVWVHPQVAINLAQWGSTKLAVKVPLWIFDWMLNKEKLKITEEKTKFVSSSGIKFEDIDPEFTLLIKKAAKFNPKEDK